MLTSGYTGQSNPPAALIGPDPAGAAPLRRPLQGSVMPLWKPFMEAPCAAPVLEPDDNAIRVAAR